MRRRRSIAGQRLHVPRRGTAMNEGDYAEFRMEPSHDQVGVVNAVVAAITAARAQGTRRLLVDLRATAGMVPPTLAQRDMLVTMWARAAAGELVLAVVAPTSLLDAERFGEMIAAAAGLCAEGFDDIDTARAWLLRQRGTTPRPLAASPSALRPNPSGKP
jgi:hypothetical protein